MRSNGGEVGGRAVRLTGHPGGTSADLLKGRANRLLGRQLGIDDQPVGLLEDAFRFIARIPRLVRLQSALGQQRLDNVSCATAPPDPDLVQLPIHRWLPITTTRSTTLSLSDVVVARLKGYFAYQSSSALKRSSTKDATSPNGTSRARTADPGHSDYLAPSYDGSTTWP